MVLSFVRMNHSPVRVRTLRGPQREVTLLSRAPARAARDPVLAVTRRRPVGRATRRREETLTHSEPEMVRVDFMYSIVSILDAHFMGTFHPFSILQSHG